MAPGAHRHITNMLMRIQLTMNKEIIAGIISIGSKELPELGVVLGNDRNFFHEQRC